MIVSYSNREFSKIEKLEIANIIQIGKIKGGGGLLKGPVSSMVKYTLCYTIRRVISGLIIVTRCGIIDKVCLKAYA